MIIVLSIMLALCIFTLIRNAFVLRARLFMIDIIFQYKNYRYYMSLFDSVNYDKMVLHFWVWPVSKMWPEELQKLRKS